MKKWFVGLMMLLALVLMQSTAMAATKCPTCNAYRTVKYTNDYEYLTEKMHKQIGVCPTCNTKLGGKFLNHTESLAATCISPAYCNQCQHYYGLKNMDNHNWSEWQPNQYFPNQHYRYCLNSCGASENEPHDGNSNCVTSATCSKCHATYKDTTKHAGPFTYTYEKIDESFHKRIETCTACGNKTGNQVETRHEEEQPANCTYGATCKVCMYEYGEPNPDNHSWSNWIYGNENQHYRFCIHNELHNQYADHRGYATCIDSMPCLDCDHPYKDPDKHQGGTDFDYTYVSDTEHKVTVTCKGCHGEIKTYQEGHSEHTPATCSSRAICAKCSTPFGDLAPNNHIGEATTTYVKTSETQHTAKITYADCKHKVDGESTDHTETTAATCTTAAYCAVCKSSYGAPDPDAHDLVQHDAQAPTCTKIGWNAYETCSRCDYTTYVEKSALGHDRVSHDAKAPTCTAIGWDAYETCSRCDYTTYAEKPALGHDIVKHDAQAPTCTEIGWDAYDTCSRCGYSTYAEKSALGHDRVSHDAQAPTCTEIGWDAYDTCSRCDYSTYVEKTALGHDIVKHDAQAPTCTAIGWDAYDTCSRCDYTTYVEKTALGHDIVKHDAQAPTCTEIGWDAYDICSRCDYTTYAEKPALGHDYAAKTTKPTCTEKGYTTHTCTRCQDSYRDEIVSALGHWYGEWTPNADGTNSAACLRDAYEHTVDCVRFSFVLAAEDVRTEFVLCPVCGEVSEIRLTDENGEVVETREAVRLLLVEDAKAEALTERLPGGELVVRMGALESGEQLMSVVFEWGGEPTQPTGQVKITLPAEVLEGHTLSLLAEDGTEAELTLEGDEEEETVSFTLDFTNSETPVQVIRLIPEV